MRKGWRPEGWEKRISFEDKTHVRPCLVSLMTEGEIKWFEAGADAMLDALLKLAYESPTKTLTIDTGYTVVSSRGGGNTETKGL